MDQTVAMLGRPGYALLLDFADGSVTPVAAAPRRRRARPARHRHPGQPQPHRRRRTATGAPSARRPPAALGVDSLRDTDLAGVERMDDPVLRRRARHVVTENQRVLDAVAALDAGDWPSLSATLDASHVSMRDDFEISCRELDLAVETSP